MLSLMTYEDGDWQYDVHSVGVVARNGYAYSHHKGKFYLYRTGDISSEMEFDSFEDMRNALVLILGSEVMNGR
jgi:hypothetical protein